MASPGALAPSSLRPLRMLKPPLRQGYPPHCMHSGTVYSLLCTPTWGVSVERVHPGTAKTACKQQQVQMIQQHNFAVTDKKRACLPLVKLLGYKYQTKQIAVKSCSPNTPASCEDRIFACGLQCPYHMRYMPDMHYLTLHDREEKSHQCKLLMFYWICDVSHV